MLTALATLPFLAALILSAAVLIHMLRENAGKIVAALKGESRLVEPMFTGHAVTVRFAPRPASVVRRSAPQWRAAA
jgi:hypothetical protein